jgi:hypothetical protein
VITLWYIGQSSWLQIQRSGFDSPALSDFLSSWSGTGSSQPREYNSGAAGIRHADYATPHYPQKFALTLPRSGGRSVGIVHSRTQATEFVLFVCLFD